MLPSAESWSSGASCWQCVSAAGACEEWPEPSDGVIVALNVPFVSGTTSPQTQRRPIGRLVMGAGLAIGVSTALAGCGGGGPSAAPAVSPTQPHASDVSNIVPLPNGVISAGAVQPNGMVWVLSGDTAVKTLSQISLSTKKPSQAVGVSADAQAVAQSSTGLLALGLGTATTGAVELLSGSSASITGTVAVGGPVRALAFGADGVTLYVLDSTATSASVSVINTSSDTVVSTIGVPADAVGLAPNPSQTGIWT